MSLQGTVAFLLVGLSDYIVTSHFPYTFMSSSLMLYCTRNRYRIYNLRSKTGRNYIVVFHINCGTRMFKQTL